ncbi:hypothetical protein [Thermococcus sp.]|uniref:hypothetical protein n=1 Tax=Thermococcus sp. TaxID=35749 RepID=UPI0026049267|nr:hypothetical protein [Thermococcus sp.]
MNLDKLIENPGLLAGALLILLGIFSMRWVITWSGALLFVLTYILTEYNPRRHH